MPPKKGLGKGLGALLGELPPAAEEASGGLRLPLQKVEPNPLQPRKHFDPDELQALADSIAEHGVIQPLTVRRMENGYYQIIAGERRWRAARLAGLDEVPAVVVEADDQKAMELALIENLQRQDLNPIEEALGYRRLTGEFGLTQEQAAARVGKSRPAVANALRLLTLPEDVTAMVADGRLSAGHARAVLSLPDEARQRAAAGKIVEQALSVRQAESLCRTLSKERPAPRPPKGIELDYLAECEKSLSSRLGRGVKIVSGRRRGRLELEFYGPDDLQTLLDALEGLRREEDTV